ncbi:DUF1735 and LamG domain-containing protein [Bacteroides neonati]|uniref:DUF1735 and LamG domain-containing protein n=1 Tax=Bacteroides neonati TaxID=1347393 RepID=UPI0004B7BD51|nr:DUF1735 and LamG domain-containing protein [Bacteroides neonati]
MKKRLNYILTGVLSFIVFGCANVDVDEVNAQKNLPNAVYMEEVESSPMKKILLEENGAVARFSARTANLAQEDVYIAYAVDTTTLNKYNEEHGKNFKILPSEYFTVERVEDVIQAGSYNTAPVKINIKKEAATLNPSYKYAIPVQVSTANSMGVLEQSSYQIFALDRILETSVMRQQGFYMKYTFPNAPVEIKEWTFHYGMKFDRLFDNQQPAMGSFYSRITSNGKLQYKAGGSDDPLAFSKQSLARNTWYHITFTYKKQHVKMYINGILETEFDVANNDNWYKIQASFGNFVGYMRDIRLYDCALTSDQIMENLYVEDPTNKHLLVYAPLTKESGLKCSVSKFKENNEPIHFHSYVSSSSDVPYDEAKIQWTSPVYFPEKK